MDKRTLRTLVLAAALGALALLSPAASAQTSRSALSPDLFAELSSGIALVRTYSCGGRPLEEGTGFLVGSSVVMTARHVVKGACRVRVLIGGRWLEAGRWTSWYRSRLHDVDSADVTTIKLRAPSGGHVFAIRAWSAARGANLAALGHPLGNNISLTQGHVVEKIQLRKVPMLAVRLLGAQGASGSPLVDDQGEVVGILQIGLGGADIIGQRTAGVILGIDLPSWWPSARRNLCHAYPLGGIPGCGGDPAPPAPAPKPKPRPRPPAPAPSPPPPPPAASGTRANPWPLGAAAGDGTWQLRVNSADFDAWPLIQQANMFNTPPPAGWVDVLINLTATYLGSGSGSLSFDFDVNLGTVGAANVVYRSYQQSCGVSPEPNDLDYTTLFQGGSATYNECWQVPATDVPSLLLLDDEWNNGFFALR